MSHSPSKTITVRAFGPDQAREWQSFLSASNNGTLFHDLDFLAYHAPGRFDERHCLFYEDNTLLALLPAAVVAEADGRRYLKSPYGGSVGGLVVGPNLRTVTALNLVRALQAHAQGLGMNGIEMRMAPSVYQRRPNDVLPFSLMVNGFRLRGRSLLFMVPIAEAGPSLLDELLTPGKRYDVRAATKKGVHPREVAMDRLQDFFTLLRDTYARLDATPTHREPELEDLARRLPGRLRLFLCAHEDREIAGVLVFMLNDRVANTFYICESSEHQKLCGPAVLIAHIMERLADEGVRYLDLGPSASESHCNEGVVFFKEGLGAQGFCRDTWRWESAGDQEA